MNSNLLVGKFYKMDPAVEDLIMGDELQEGMVVLVESVALKADPNDVPSEPQLNHLMKANRWCEVSNLRRIPTGLEVQIQFVGVYADGTKSVRIYRDNTGWFVKKDSLPTPPENMANPDAEGETEKNGPITVPFDSQGWGQGELLHEDHVKYVEGDAAATMSMWEDLEGDNPETKSLDAVQQELTAELQFHVKSPVDWDQVMGIIQRVAPPITRNKHIDIITTENRHSFDTQG